MRIFYVYLHKSEDGKFQYIGKGCNRRAWNMAGRSAKWLSTFLKEPKVTILFDNLSESTAFDLEQAEIVIRRNDVECVLINIAAGGYGGDSRNWDDTSRKLLSDARKGNGSFWYGKKREPETYEKGQRTKEERGTVTRYWQGKKRDPKLMEAMNAKAHTPEAITKMKETKKANPTVYTEERREKIRQAMLKREMTDEIRKNISKARKGQGNFRTGTTHSEETKANMSKAATGRIMSRESVEKRKETIKANGGFKHPAAKQVRCLQTGEVFRSAREASQKMFDGVGEKVIQQVCVGAKKGYRGYQFEHFKAGI